MVRYGLLLNLKKFHKILIKSIRLRERTSLDIRTYERRTYERKYIRTDGQG